MYGRGELSNGLFGAGDFFLNVKVTDPLMAPILTFYFFQMSFATTASSIVSGAIAERCKFSAYIMISFMMTLIYAIGGGWLWGNHGWLKNIGVIEFSGAGPVHVIGGAACKFQQLLWTFIKLFISISFSICLVHQTSNWSL